jgi:Putative auto-transporter adhesin, head GIN domain
MKKLIVVVTLFVTSYLQAQVTKNLGDFDSVKVFDKITLKLIPSHENKAIITGTRASEVEVINKNGVVKLRMPFPKLLAGDEINVQLYFKRIESIDASEGSFVWCDLPFKQTTFSLNTKEGATIKADLDTERVTVRAVSGGILDLRGKTTSQVVTIASGGVLEGMDLISSQIIINVSAGGKAEIHATALVDAKVTAGGSIYIYGKPKQINQETILGGTIIEK